MLCHLLSLVHRQISVHFIPWRAHFSNGTVDKNGRKWLFPVCFADHSPVLWILLTDSWNPWNCSGSETGREDWAFIPWYLLFALPPCFSPLLSTILLPPYNIFQPALNYWPVWSPVRLHHYWDVVHQQRHSFFFFFVEFLDQNENTVRFLSEVSGVVTFHYHRIQIQTVGWKKNMNKYILSEWIVAL